MASTLRSRLWTGLSVGLLVAGCGSAGNATPAPAPDRTAPALTAPTSGSAAPSTGSTGTASPSGGTPPIVSIEPPPSATTTTLSGTIAEGVQPSCTILDAGAAGTFELAGQGAQGLRPGERVRVTGHRVEGVATHCQQGPLFQVDQAQRLPSG